MTSKRRVLGIGLIAAAIGAIATTRTWVSGTVHDAVLADSHVSVSGGKAAPAVMACLLVCAAGLVAAATSGRITRVVSAVLATVASAGALVATVIVLHDPEQAIQDRAAGLTGRTGRTDVGATMSVWPWITLVATLGCLLAAVLALVGVRSWGGLSASYEAPGTKPRETVSDWDRLSRGEDPTAETGEQMTE